MSKEKFLRVYANLPETERSQIIAIVDNEPYTWNIAYHEIINDTLLGKKILKKLEEMNLL